MKIRKRSAIVAVVAGLAVAVGAAAVTAATSGLPKGSEVVKLDPADFTTRIDNPYWPMKPGTRWVYRETDPEGTVQRVVVRVANQTKTIANGIVARVVRDTVTEDGKLVEDTWDWYAQDKAGTSGTSAS